jgi:hypothetical protein
MRPSAQLNVLCGPLPALRIGHEVMELSAPRSTQRPAGQRDAESCQSFLHRIAFFLCRRLRLSSGVRKRLLMVGDVAVVAFAAVFLWVGNEMKWAQGITPVHPPAKNIPMWIAAACVALVAARLFGRLRRR